MRALALCAAVAAATAVAADDRVLVLSAQSQLLHPASSPQASPAGFSSLGLAELAMDALGLGSGRSPAAATAQSALQADVFRHTDVYALVTLQDDGALLEAVEAATTFPPTAFHSVFPLAARVGASQRTPGAIAGELTVAGAGRVKCAGSTALCARQHLAAGHVTTPDALVESVLTEHRFLHRDVAEDAQFARDLAQVRQLTGELLNRQIDALVKLEKTLVVVGFSDVETLDGSKRSDARTAIVTHVSAFLSALQATHAAAGAQVVATRETLALAAVQLTAWKRLDAVTSYSRLLAALATEPSGSSDDDDDDDDDSGSGSESDEDEVGVTNDKNATATAERVSLEEIAEYQIVLWTSVLLVTTLLLVVLAMCNMNTGRDSLLYAKFIADVNHRKAD
jgi:hypothetical protein